MRALVSLTKQGQISIPAKIRRKLGWEAVDKLTVREEDGKVIVEEPTDLMSLKGVFSKAGKKNKGKSMEQILEEEQRAVEKARLEQYRKKLEREQQE